MRQLDVKRLKEYDEIRRRVSRGSTVSVRKNSYSVPSRLIGEEVQVRISEWKVEVRYKGRLQLSCARLLGESKARIDYRHIIWSLVKTPDAFERYRHRESLFPSIEFRRAYDRFQEAYGAGRRADVAYLQLLHHAAATMEIDVKTALELLLEAGEIPTLDRVKQLMNVEQIEFPEQSPMTVDLEEYSDLLTAKESR